MFDHLSELFYLLFFSELNYRIPKNLKQIFQNANRNCFKLKLMIKLSTMDFCLLIIIRYLTLIPDFTHNKIFSHYRTADKILLLIAG